MEYTYGGKTIAQVRDIAQSAQLADWNCLALRTQDYPFTLGASADHSYQWYEGESTGEALDGLCGTGLWASNISWQSDQETHYQGKHLAIVAGTSAEYGQDEGELVLKDPVVIAVLR